MEQKPTPEKPPYKSERAKRELAKIPLREAFEILMAESESDERLITREDAYEMLRNGSWEQSGE